jgi:translation initiation factor eIF-2B subunit epsilon
LIGSATIIEDDVQIIASVIGDRCTIGAGTIVRNSYIFDDAKIGPNCVIDQSIVACKVQIKRNSQVPKGCLIGDEVIIGPDAVLEPFERLSVKLDEDEGEDDEDDEDDEDELEEGKVDSISDVGVSFFVVDQDAFASSLGKDSNALIWRKGPSEDDEDEDGPDNYSNLKYLRIGTFFLFDAGLLLTCVLGDNSSAESTISEEEDSSSDDSELSDDETSTTSFEQPLKSPTAIRIHSGATALEKEFQAEVKQSLERAFSEGHSVDNAAVELKTLRMASNVPITSVRELVVGAIVDRIKIADNPAAQRQEISKVIERWGELINRIGGVDAVETISILQVSMQHGFARNCSHCP